ncbi:hypothetical protein IC607_03545 [Cellulomonas sp. JH27-2]|uniref:hypothetical protein n=1 Tax=Cellulomonas sp. JH27-2 TaxID=2774139 RepID=UPI00178584BE|nr:hypothetical protein [Cellulomonas sp. JH27-2]MBD8058039.1 hypothetical protein [Cellulomonas sp. JH27-2]
MPARHHAAARVWGSIAASALVAGSLVSIGAPAQGAPAQNALAGRQACYEVRARDAIGRVSAWSNPRCTYVAAAATSHALDAERVATRGGHKVAVLSSALPGGNGSGRSTSANIFMQESRGVRIQVRTCPSCGTFNVQVGKKVMTVRTKSSTTGWTYVTLRWKSQPTYVFFDEVTPYPHPRATSSYLRSWTLIRSQ